MIKELGTLRENDRGGQTGYKVYSPNGYCPTILSQLGGYGLMILIPKTICRMTGRNPDNPKSRQAGLPTAQRLEVKEGGLCNTITTVQKDNLLLMERQDMNIKRLGNIYNENVGTGFAGNVWDKDDLCPTLTTMQGGGREPFLVDETMDEDKYKIRKLTPRESWRLMGFTDEDFDKASQVNSNTQLYKQAGNSIVKPVLMAIFKQMMGSQK